MAQASYRDLMTQITKLQAQADMLRRRQIELVINNIQMKMKQYNLSLEDLKITGRNKTRKDYGSKPLARFRHPETGVTWSGRGKVPKWINETIGAEANK